MAGEQDTEITAPAEPPSIADSIGDAIESIGLDDQGDEQPPAAAPARDRDPAGRFSRRTADAPRYVEPLASPAAPVAAPVAPAAPAAVAPEADAPPTSWKDEEKAEWGRLPPGAKAAIQRREREVTQGLQRAAESRKFGDSVYQEVAPYMEILRAEGATPQAAIKTLLETAYVLRHGSSEHKRTLMLSLINQYGIDFSQPIDQSRAAMEHELDARRHAEMRQRADSETRVEREAYSEVEEFARAPGHEHLETVRPYMIALLNGGIVKTLQEAYDQAVRANPATRSAVQMQENMQRSQNVQRNRNAASSVTGNPGNVAVKAAVDPKNLRDTLEAAFSAGRI